MAPRIPNEDLDEEVDAGPGTEGQDGQDGEEADDAAGQAGEEGEEGEDGLLDPDEPPARETRGSGRISRLSNEVQELRRQLRDRDARPAPAAPAAAQPQEETEEAFRARLALLAPHEQVLETQSRSERRFARVLQANAMQQQDMLDKVQFDTKAASNPRYKRYADDVEKLRTELMQQGQLVPRQILLEVVIGRKVLANDGALRGKGQQRQAAQRRVAAATTKPGQARSDVPAQRGRLSEKEARAKRLENLQI